MGLGIGDELGIVLAGTDGFTTTTVGTTIMPATGAMSRMKLKLSFSSRVELVAFARRHAMRFPQSIRFIYKLADQNIGIIPTRGHMVGHCGGLEKRGIPAARGGKWSAVQVAGLLTAAEVVTKCFCWAVP